jgi:hypothetical protein
MTVMDPEEGESLLTALALATAWSDVEVDAWLSITSPLDSWEDWQPVAWGLAHLAHLLAERIATMEETTVDQVIWAMAMSVTGSTPDDAPA